MTEIREGAEIRIPAGSCLTSNRTYFARVLEVYRADAEGYSYVRLEKTNSAGRTQMRSGKPVTVVKFIRTKDVQPRV